MYWMTGHWPEPMPMRCVNAVPYSKAMRPFFACSVAASGSSGDVDADTPIRPVARTTRRAIALNAQHVLLCRRRTAGEDPRP